MGVRGLAAHGLQLPAPLTFLAGLAQQAADQGDGPQRVVVGGDRVRHPRRVGVGVDDADRGHAEQPTLVQADLVLQRVQAHDQVRAHGGVVAGGEFPAVLLELVVVDVDHLDAAGPQDLLAVGQAAGHPAVEDVVAPGQLGRVDRDLLRAVAGADEEDDAAPPGDLLDHLGRPQEVGVRRVQGDDVDAVPHAEDVAAVGRVPERRRVAEVRLVREEHREREAGGGGGVPQEGGRVVGLDEVRDPARLSLLASPVPVESLQVSERGGVGALGLLEGRRSFLHLGRREGLPGLVEALYPGHDVGIDVGVEGSHRLFLVFELFFHRPGRGRRGFAGAVEDARGFIGMARYRGTRFGISF